MGKKPCVVIAALRSSAGKTSIATGLMGALARCGYRVQGFKVGPDFIDPGYHTAVTGRWSRNLDTWLLSYSQVKEIFERAAADADVAVIEGVMGLFDGVRGEGERASTAEVAKLLGCPVILVVDVSAQARSAVAEFLGCRAMDPGLTLAGVILNRVRGPHHLEIVKSGFADFGVPVLGAIQEGSIPRFPERHLGLVPVLEQREIKNALGELVEAVARQVDLAAVFEVARSALESSGAAFEEESGLHSADRAFEEVIGDPPLGEKVRIAFAWDQAFNFYYRDGLELLEGLGVELVPFSPLRDERIPPEVGGILLGGGFPELFAEQLAANSEMRQSLRHAHAWGMPIYAECGGFIYLCEELVDWEGRSFPMVGLIPGKCRMEKRLVGMGYRRARALEANLLCRANEVLRGHEFHYSSFTPKSTPFPWAFSFLGEKGERFDGYFSGNLLASYLHFHFASLPRAAARFVNHCRAWLRQHFF
ncbi:MAG TPA: cobyrinate a,c-diamide synthase [Peptococcaceae bacterium]|nr:cobyrinate a,c-diamide synthase [Peptococcaceae bacterium]